VERLWRSLKYEEVYLKDYATVREARSSIDAYFRFYNVDRLHQALGYQTPYEIYAGTRTHRPGPVPTNPISRRTFSP